VSFSELENDTLNQAELNEIKINESNLIFEVPGLNENPRRRTLIRVYVKMSEIHETGGV
jgi:hypothetical protein